ncbi:MAG: hypothetical protein RLZZ369_2417, partial [Pseudomonadota bacterium]
MPASASDDLIQQHVQYLTVQKRLAGRTISMYQEAFARLKAFYEKDKLHLEQVRPHHVRGWIARLHAQGLGPRSIAITLAAWRGLWRWMGKEGLSPLNPADGIKAPKAPKPLPKALAVDQAVALAVQGPPNTDGASSRDAAEAPWLHARDHAMIELLYSSGLRSAELLGLDVQASAQALGWIDLQAGEAHVLGKGSKRRIVPVGKAALTALNTWLAMRDQLKPPKDEALFISRLGSRLTPMQLRNRLKQIGQQAGLSTHVHPHMLRHSFASHLL